MSQCEIVRPVNQRAAYHVQILHKKGYENLIKFPDIRGFGRDAFSTIQKLAKENTPRGFRVIMRSGEFGGQPAEGSLALDLLGGEILRTTIKSMYDPNKELKPSEVDSKSDAECVFDKIVSGKIPVPPLLNEEGIFVFKPSEMLAKEHLLFIPTIHWRDISKVTDINFFGTLFVKIVNFANREEFKGGFLLESNNGPWAGQIVPHLHFHMRGGEKLESPFWQDWQK